LNLKMENLLKKNDDHLAQMQELLGRMPKIACANGKYTSDYFNRRGDLRYIKDLKFWPLKDVLYEKYRFSERDSKEISEFLLPMLSLTPRERATAQQMLTHPWIIDVDVHDFSSAWR